MRKDTMAEAALHLMVLMAMTDEGKGLPAAKLASFHDLSSGSVAKLLQKLTAAGLVSGAAGRNGCYKLARSPTQITALEIVEALDGVVPYFHCREIRKDGFCKNITGNFSPRCSIARMMDEAAAAWRRSLGNVRLAQLVSQSGKTVDPKLGRATVGWIAANSR